MVGFIAGEQQCKVDGWGHRWSRPSRWLREYRVWCERCAKCGVVRLWTATGNTFLLFPGGEWYEGNSTWDKWPYSIEKLKAIAEKMRVELEQVES